MSVYGIAVVRGIFRRLLRAIQGETNHEHYCAKIDPWTMKKWCRELAWPHDSWPVLPQMNGRSRRWTNFSTKPVSLTRMQGFELWLSARLRGSFSKKTIQRSIWNCLSIWESVPCLAAMVRPGPFGIRASWESIPNTWQSWFKSLGYPSSLTRAS